MAPAAHQRSLSQIADHCPLRILILRLLSVPVVVLVPVAVLRPVPAAVLRPVPVAVLLASIARIDINWAWALRAGVTFARPP